MRLTSTRDLACLAILVPLAPVLYFLHPELPWMSKDGLAYLTFARGLFSGFALALPAWIHVDSGMILPPVRETYLSKPGFILQRIRQSRSRSGPGGTSSARYSPCSPPPVVIDTFGCFLRL